MQPRELLNLAMQIDGSSEADGAFRTFTALRKMLDREDLWKIEREIITITARHDTATASAREAIRKADAEKERAMNLLVEQLRKEYL